MEKINMKKFVIGVKGLSIERKILANTSIEALSGFVHSFTKDEWIEKISHLRGSLIEITIWETDSAWVL
jgi:hypothetical protein